MKKMFLIIGIFLMFCPFSYSLPLDVEAGFSPQAAVLDENIQPVFQYDSDVITYFNNAVVFEHRELVRGGDAFKRPFYLSTSTTFAGHLTSKPFDYSENRLL